jgi:hypothetical protein
VSPWFLTDIYPHGVGWGFCHEVWVNEAIIDQHLGLA